MPGVRGEACDGLGVPCVPDTATVTVATVSARKERGCDWAESSENIIKVASGDEVSSEY